MCLELKINTSKCLSDEPIKMPYFENVCMSMTPTITLILLRKKAKNWRAIYWLILAHEGKK